MTDQKQDNEEYHYDDLGAFESDLNAEEKTPEMHMADAEDRSFLSNPVIRNALIAVTVVIVLMSFYKIYGWFSAKKTVASMPLVKPLVQPIEKPPEIVLPKVQPVQPAVQPVSPEVEKKLSTLESAQQSIQSNISTMEGQMTNVGHSVAELNQKLESLTQTLNVLNEKIERQTQALNILDERTKPKPPVIIHHPKIKKPLTAPSVYYIQAIIPGRAWLILPNGTTITVRNGSHVPGYGSITFIDPRQGRIVTSSGRVIRFSPADN